MLTLDQVRQTIEFFHSANQLDTTVAIARGCYNINSQNPEVLDLYAQTLFRAKRFQESLDMALRVLEMMPDNCDALFNAARCLHYTARAPEAEMLIRKVLKQKPHWLDAKLDLSLYLAVQGKHAESEKLLRTMLNENPGDQRVTFNLGWHDLQHGDFKKGMAGLAVGRNITVWGTREISLPYPKWDRTDPKGKTILLVDEGGDGDAIICARFAKLLKARGARVILIARDNLVSVFSRVEGVDQVMTKDEIQKKHTKIRIDGWIPGMDAPRYCDVDYDTLPSDPYITPDPKYLKKWKKIIGDGPELKVGIRWQGNPKFEHDQVRTIPASKLFQLAEIPNVKVFSLQRDDGVEALQGQTQITNLSSQLGNWEDAIAATACLDLVITSCTAIAHVAATQNIPTWVIVPIMPYYIWAQPGETSRWYQTVRIFRQTKYGSWDEPCWQVIQSLKKQMS